VRTTTLGLETLGKKGIPLREADLSSADALRSAIRAQSKISVVVTTYEHERYLRQCLASVLMQEGDFDLEVIVGDDHSSDGTGDIVGEFAERYPDTVRAVISERNLGMRQNLRRCLDLCTGRYVAICEGDDYWTSRWKLKKQLAFMRENADCAMCFNWLLLYRQGEELFEPHPQQAGLQGSKLTFEDLSAAPLIGNFSCCFYRAEAVREIPDKYYELDEGADWPFNLCIAQHGDIGFLRELLSVYRIHEGGLWSGRRKADMQQTIRASRQRFLGLFGEGRGFDGSDERALSPTEVGRLVPDEGAGFLCHIDGLDLMLDTLKVRGWAALARQDTVHGTRCGLVFLRPDGAEPVHAYYFPASRREDVVRDLRGRFGRVEPSFLGFESRRTIQDGEGPWRLGIFYEDADRLCYRAIGWTVRRGLNAWMLEAS
jgi:hypothetical protein